MKPTSLMVVGTDTSVGKTVVTALLSIAYRREGVSAVPFKPIATGTTGDRSPDIDFLAAASGVEENIGLYSFHEPLSPHLAAAAEDGEIDAETILKKFYALESANDAVLVEGVGGVMVPLNSEWMLIDLAVELDLPVIVVTRATLGTINHTLLTVEACRDRGLSVAGLVVNLFPERPSEAEKTNPDELRRLCGVPLLGILPVMDVSVDEGRTGNLADYCYLLDLEALGSAGPDKGRALEADRRHVWHPFTQMTEYLNESPHPLMITRADGCYLRDSEGRRYLDGISSLWVNLHGHRHPRLDRAVRTQLGKVAHTTLLGLANEPSSLLAERLSRIAPGGLSKVFFSDNGSTAVEIALKVAFQYQRLSGRPEKNEFVSFVNAYHGDTVGAVSVGGHETFHSIFRPLLFPAHLVPAAYCYRCPVGRSYPGCSLDCLESFRLLLEERRQSLAAVVVEPKVQGAAGIIVQPPGYLAAIAELCRRHDILLIADEVATGFGRTGALFACEHDGIEPDIMTLAKGLTGGYLPLAATLFRDEIYDAFLGRYEEMKTFFHGHSYTGNPLGAAAALANLELIEEDGWLEKVNSLSADLAELLTPIRELSIVGEVRQCGLMVGIELVSNRETREPFPVARRIGREVILKARERGVVIRPLGDIVVLMPAPAFSPQQLEDLTRVTHWAVEETSRRFSGVRS